MAVAHNAEVVLRQGGPTSTAVLIVRGKTDASGGRAPPEPDTAVKRIHR